MNKQSRIVQTILEKAESSGRYFLLEPEVYCLLGAYGLPVPRHFFWPKGQPLTAASLKKLGTERVVVKIVSPLILHKSDVGGVAIVRASLREVKAAVNKMYTEIPHRYSRLFGQGWVSAAEVAESIQGVLVAELLSYEQAGLGSELLLGLRVSRDFGPVITFGGGGLEVEFLNAHLREGHSLAIIPPSGLNRSQTAKELEALAVFGKVARKFRGREPLVKPETLLQVIGIFQTLARDFSPFDWRSPFTLEELEVNPLVIRQGRLIPLDGLCRFSREKMEAAGRPVAQIQQLLEPKSLAIIGVSEKMNVGHIILNNVIQNGFPREKIYVVKPGLDCIEGCRCVPSVAELPETVDLFILTLGAEMVYPLMKDLVELEKARSVIVIAGGLGEKSGTQSIEDDIRNLIKTRRLAGRPAPVVNGGNCLGIISAPGKYDSTFIPEYKFRKPSGLQAGLAIVSQSGAFMLSRMSKQDRFEPVYAISVGNQLDLTLGDYLTYLKDRPEVRIVAVYAEGFRPGDGWRFLQAVRDTVRAGKKVVVYKSGRSPEGRKATASHTASVAGDYAVGRNLLRQAGAIVAETIEEFENLIKALILLEGKKITGRRVGLMSNAGFESVIMADNLKGEDGELVLEQFSGETVARIMKVLQPLGIDRLQDVHNPLDVTPMADDATFCGCVEALLQDSRIDCAVISCVPMTAALQTLPPGEQHRENVFSETSLAGRLVSIFRNTDKPLVVNIDAGRWYDPLAEHLEKSGLPVFRCCDQAVRFMRKLVSAGLKEL
ncbi:MAG: acetate--CoA ligase family protein [Candidatus Saccharicenans sp.]|uniref:acetate--CoA ligase family protein n=1 Tax=Candidatus Saccharicenans sp. TaxID=2819258 RepID=UPI00404A35A2